MQQAPPQQPQPQYHQPRPQYHEQFEEEVKDVPKHQNPNPFGQNDDEEKYELDMNKCGYCRKPFTPQEESANQVGMFMTEDCFHRFHIPCFKEYAKSQLLNAKKVNNEVVFGEVKCLTCGKPVSEME